MFRWFNIRALVNGHWNQFPFRYCSDSSLDAQPLLAAVYDCARCNKDRWQALLRMIIVLQNVNATILYFMCVCQFDISGAELSEKMKDTTGVTVLCRVYIITKM